MYHLNCFLDERHEQILKGLSYQTDLGITGVIRRMLDSFAPLQGMMISGAMVVGIRAVTTSGNIWVSRGL